VHKTLEHLLTWYDVALSAVFVQVSALERPLLAGVTDKLVGADGGGTRTPDVQMSKRVMVPVPAPPADDALPTDPDPSVQARICTWLRFCEVLSVMVSVTCDQPFWKE